ncbi:hypothetical protein U9M48_000789 [Paspalum notatum var. saurae]|uniref:non-specific serine/threonine protein kinase n=1 Tax=Paspalum notatum var. saurae TaxID=547442 RepID=A0AAQ3PF72_PASNO
MGDECSSNAIPGSRVRCAQDLAARRYPGATAIDDATLIKVLVGNLKDGTQIAIKKLSAESKQGISEFLTEINVISNVRHPNLIKLIGCCVEGNNRLLVYEYAENNSSANALLGSKNKCIPLDWQKRAAICIGTASGLAFLHEEAQPRIIHRDIMASNILLDKKLLPKIGNFGLAKLFPDTSTHVTTRVAGTMLTWKLREQGRLLEIVDPDLEDYPAEKMLRFIKVALLCTQAMSRQRPSMKQVVNMLSNQTEIDLQNVVPPGVLKEPRQRTSGFGGLTVDTSSSQSTKCNPAESYSTQTNMNSVQFSTTDVSPR